MTLSDGTTTYTFALLPGQMTPIRSDKICAAERTYSDIAYFSWGASIIGKEITLTWNAMPAAMWASLDSLYSGDKSLVWNPTLDGSAVTTYNVEMTQFDGEYFLGGYDTSLDSSWRQNVIMTLLITSAVA